MVDAGMEAPPPLLPAGPAISSIASFLLSPAEIAQQNRRLTATGPSSLPALAAARLGCRTSEAESRRGTSSFQALLVLCPRHRRLPLATMLGRERTCLIAGFATGVLEAAGRILPPPFAAYSRYCWPSLVPCATASLAVERKTCRPLAMEPRTRRPLAVEKRMRRPPQEASACAAAAAHCGAEEAPRRPLAVEKKTRWRRIMATAGERLVASI